MVAVRTACTVVYRHADPGATLTNFFSGVFSPPAKNVRLWEFRNVAVASYNGTRGTMCGPWPTEKHLAAPVIAVRIIPSRPHQRLPRSQRWATGGLSAIDDQIVTYLRVRTGRFGR